MSYSNHGYDNSKLLCGWVLSQQLTVSVWTIKNKNNLIKPIDIVGKWLYSMFNSQEEEP